jgi:hypothetical protein
MQRLEPTPTHAPEGVTRTRCAKCRRFARLLPEQTWCDRCIGALPLDFGRGER